MNEFSKYVGLDVHKETIAVSVAEAWGGEVRYLGEIANTPEAIEKLVKQLRKGGAILSFCYEAENLRLFKSPDQNDVTPSAIFIDKRGNKYVGKRAYDQAARNPESAATLRNVLPLPRLFYGYHPLSSLGARKRDCSLMLVCHSFSQAFL